MNIIKPLGSEIQLSASGNTINNALLVYCATSSAAQVNVAFSNGAVKSSFVLPANQYIFVEKQAGDLLSANATVSAVQVAYRG